MTDHTEFESHLDAHPDDWEYRLVYADWLEEQGDVFCETQRWMVANFRAPQFYLPEDWNWWGYEGNWEMNERDFTYHLRRRLWLKLANQGEFGLFKQYLTRHAAERDLHNALVLAGEIHCALIEEVEA